LVILDLDYDSLSFRNCCSRIFTLTFLFVCLHFNARSTRHIILSFSVFLNKDRNTLRVSSEVREIVHSTINKVKYRALSDHHARRISHLQDESVNW